MRPRDRRASHATTGPNERSSLPAGVKRTSSNRADDFAPLSPTATIFPSRWVTAPNTGCQRRPGRAVMAGAESRVPGRLATANAPGTSQRSAAPHSSTRRRANEALEDLSGASMSLSLSSRCLHPTPGCLPSGPGERYQSVRERYPVDAGLIRRSRRCGCVFVRQPARWKGAVPRTDRVRPGDVGAACAGVSAPAACSS